MKKISSVFVPFFIVAFFLLTNLSGAVVAHAAANLPSTPVWFTPATATAGTPVVLNALVYNNQTISATITVTFATPTATIGTVTELVSAGTAKTFSYNWKMPSTTTTITATVTAAVGSNKQPIPALLGTLGSTSFATTSVLSNISIPSTGTIDNWFSTTFATIEVFRNKEAISFSAQRDTLKSTMGANTTNAFGNPSNYLALIYSSAAASLFSSAGLFYIVLLLIVLLLLKFIVNLIF